MLRFSRARDARDTCDTRDAHAAREREFTRLYNESFATVYGYVRARAASDADAQDIVSEAFLNAARSFDAFDPARASFATWVVSIARNCMVSHYRREREHAVLDDVPESAFEVAPEQDASLDLMLVKQLLACLDAEERELIALKYHDGMRNADIAQALGMNPSTVSSKLARALDKMRKLAERSQ